MHTAHARRLLALQGWNGKLFACSHALFCSFAFLWRRFHGEQLEAQLRQVSLSVQDKINNFLQDETKQILHVDSFVNKDNTAELIYLFEAILNDGQHLQILYLQGSKLHHPAGAAGAANRASGALTTV